MNDLPWWFELRGYNFGNFINSWVVKPDEKQVLIALSKYKYTISVALSYQSEWISLLVFFIRLYSEAGEEQFRH